MKRMKKKTQKFLFIIVFLFLLALGLKYSMTRLTYIETGWFDYSSDSLIKVHDAHSELRQEFIAPYDLLNKVSIQIVTFSRTNNSQWEINIWDSKNQKLIFHTVVNASKIVDNAFYDIDFKRKNLKLVKGNLYELQIKSINANEQSGLAFYVTDESIFENASLYLNDDLQMGSLCMKVYGGDIDWWWTKLFLFIIFWYLMLGYLYFKAGANGTKSIKQSSYIQSIILTFLIFLMWCTFSTSGQFLDEFDNIQGGMLIAKGQVLYRDYVTQHTPVAYYLCALFALFGAASITQMRLLYYILQAVVWGGLYYRHAPFFGRRKMFLLPILECIFITSIAAPQGYMILSDGIQGLCMVTLALEFLRYLDDHILGWQRVVIASICIWGSFGAAFVSAYALIFLVLILITVEVNFWSIEKITLKKIINRYYRLFLSVVIPFIGALTYFAVNHALLLAYNLTFKFNVEVYSMYTGGFGSNVFQPFINAIQNYFNILSGNINKVFTAQASNVEIIELVIISLTTSIVFNLYRKKCYSTAAMLFSLVCFNATRGYNFHGLAAWYVAILVITLFWNDLFTRKPTVAEPILVCVAAFSLSIYIKAVGDNMLAAQETISEIEAAVIAQTEPEDGILVEACACDFIYFLYRDRYPVNRNVYFLPWYMAWYEQATIDDLKNNNPQIVIYNPDMVIWTYYANYSSAFLNELKTSYVQYSENPGDGWRYALWLQR